MENLTIVRSPLSQKVINYLVKCFSYATAQNKGDSKGIQAAIKSIVPHAFGNHSKCDSWCKFKSNPATYRHKDLPHGKELHGEKLQSALTNIFNDYCTDALAEKLAPMTNSQRNEALNSVIGSKIQRSDFMVAVKAMISVWPVVLPKQICGTAT